MESVTDFIFGSSKITTDGDCSHEIKRCLLLWRRAMTNLDSTLKSRDITLPTKVCLVKAMVFPVVTYGCESWTVRKAEHRRIGAFDFSFFLNFKIFNSYMRSQTWTPLPPPSPQHLSGLSPCTSPKQAAPYIRHGLATMENSVEIP